MTHLYEARQGADARRSGDDSQARRRRLVSWRFAKTNGAALGLSALQQRYVAEVNGRIASGEYRLERGSCACGADEADVIAQVDRYGLALDTVMCKACGTLRFDPYLSAESLADFYRVFYQDMYARARDADTYFQDQGRYGTRLLRTVRDTLPTGAVVAEVGCGAGGALSVFRDAGYETYGCDYSARLIELGKKRGLENLHLGDMKGLVDALSVASKKASLIFLHHVFEHLSSPEDWLITAQGILAENGTIIIAVPDVSAIHRYPSPDGDLRLFLHIAHKFNFSLGGLSAIASRTGLHASLASVEKSNQAPEVWVAFTRSALPERDIIPKVSSGALFRRLRLIELDYIRRAVLRKLAKSAEACRHALGTLLPNRDNRL